MYIDSLVTTQVSKTKQRVFMMSEDVRAQLRQDFLKVLRHFEGKTVDVKLVNNQPCQETKVLAFDRDTLHMIASPLKTPNDQTLPSAILRLTDVDSVTLRK